MTGRETRQYWIDQLTEYWESGFTIQEYCELKDLPYESTRRWISQLKKEREHGENKEAPLDFVEVTLPVTAGSNRGAGIKLYSNGVEICIGTGTDLCCMRNGWSEARFICRKGRMAGSN